MNVAPHRARARRAGLAVVAAALSCLTGCPNTNLITNRPSIEDAEDQVTSCKVAKDPLNPMIIEWPAINRSQL
ncbi:MAG: hypothetical protein HY908_27890, partial [Myxococcales bacterium]|nr:hypothetical protein [Myxococcales bacterium]